MEQAKATIQEHIAQNEIIIFTKTYCPYCVNAKELLSKIGVRYQEVAFDTRQDGSVLQGALNSLFSVSTVPQTFVRGERLGGYDNLCELERQGVLLKKLGVAN